MPGGTFFEQPETASAIDQLAAVDSITLIPGAGVSMESGLPSWGALVDGLLRRVALTHDLAGADLDAFVAWTKSEGPAAAASIARSNLPAEEFIPAICEALYRAETEFAPGATAEAITRVRLAFGPGRSRTATTNYDTLLEQAGDDAAAIGGHEGWPSAVKVRTIVDDSPEHEDELAVRHLHGVIAPGCHTTGDVVLAEGDYHLMQHPEQWQERWFSKRLAASTVAFIGTSLTDPNLLRYLHRAQDRRGGAHVAVFSRQDDAERYAANYSTVVAAHEAAIDARWRSLDVTPLRCDYYTQSAQLMFEVASRRALGGGYRPLPERLAEWEAEIASTTFTVRQPHFNTLQDDLQALLGDLVAALRERLEAEGIGLNRDERMQGSLWLYQPSRESLVNWCSSDRAWRNPETMEPVPVEWDSPYAAVRAFCSGSVAEHSTREQVATRWNHVVGAPLWLDEEPWGRLPVGVLTLASTGSHDDSVLARGLSVLRGDALPTIAVPQLVTLFRP